MDLKNKRYQHFLLFCNDLDTAPEDLAYILESMRQGQTKTIFGKKISLEKITDTVSGKLYTVSLYDENKTQIRRSPIYVRKPPRRRRSIAQIQATVMIIAIVLIAGAMVYAATLERNDILTYDVSCMITQKDLYDTGNGVAYLILGVTNTGNQDIDITMEIMDDDNNAVSQNIGLLYPGEIVQHQISMNAEITEGQTYVIHVTGTTQKDSVDCSELVVSK